MSVAVEVARAKRTGKGARTLKLTAQGEQKMKLQGGKGQMREEQGISKLC